MKIGKKIAIILGIIILFLSTIIACAFSKNGYVQNNNKDLYAINKVKLGERKLQKVNLNDKEVNDVLSIIYKDSKKKGPYIVKTPQVSIEKEKVIVKVPVVFKNKTFIFSSKGKVSLKEDDLIFIPSNFKVGKLILPKSFVMKKINRINNVAVKEKEIHIDPKVLPFALKNLEVKSSNIVMDFKKLNKATVFDTKEYMKKEIDNLKVNLVKLKDKVNSKEEKDEIENIINLIEKGGLNNVTKDEFERALKKVDDLANRINSKDKIKDANKVKKEINNNVKEITKKEGNRVNLLDNLQGQLSTAASRAGSQGGREIINLMTVSASALKSNPNFNYNGNASEAKRIYKKLSPKQKETVKNAIYSSVDMGLVGEIRSAFGI